MSKQTHILQTQNLNVGYADNATVLLENINICASLGEFISLIGKNGIGKSTLLKTLIGLQNPISGDVFIGNENLKSISIENLAKKISFVSTENIRIPNLKVSDFIALGRAPYTNWYGVLNNVDHKIIFEAIDLVNIKNIKNKNIDKLSDGERQRALIARALAQDTDIIFLDEPTAFLDLQNKYEIFHLLNKLSKEKQKTIIFSTHDLNLALNESDKIWLLADKQIIEGMPEEIVLNNSINKLFDNSQLLFEKTSGEFVKKQSNEKNISLIGSGVEFIWTKRALIRNNFNIVENAEISISIKTVNSTIWELKQNGNVLKFDSLSGLIEGLK